MKRKARKAAITLLTLASQMGFAVLVPLIAYCKCSATGGCQEESPATACCHTETSCCDGAHDSDGDSQEVCSSCEQKTCHCLKVLRQSADRVVAKRQELIPAKPSFEYIAFTAADGFRPEVRSPIDYRCVLPPQPTSSVSARLALLGVWLN